MSAVENGPVEMLPDGTCRQEYLVGQPVNAPALPDPPAPARAATGTSTDTGPLSSCIQCQRSGSQGYTYVQYIDPINIIVNSIESYLFWQWNNCCVLGSTGGEIYTYYSTSGWNPPNPNSNSISYYCLSGGLSLTSAYFYNGIFCNLLTGTLGNSTYAQYNSVNFWGYSTGDFQGTWDTALVGYGPAQGCTNLLRRAVTIYYKCNYGNC